METIRTAEKGKGGDGDDDSDPGRARGCLSLTSALDSEADVDSLKLDGFRVILGFQALMRRAMPATGSGRRGSFAGMTMPSAKESPSLWGPIGEDSDEVTLRQKSWTVKRCEIWHGICQYILRWPWLEATYASQSIGGRTRDVRELVSAGHESLAGRRRGHGPLCRARVRSSRAVGDYPLLAGVVDHARGVSRLRDGQMKMETGEREMEDGMVC